MPPELGMLRGLTHLDLSGNELDGPVPVALVTASTLEHMDISGNSLDWSTVGRQGPRRGCVRWGAVRGLGRRSVTQFMRDILMRIINNYALYDFY